MAWKLTEKEIESMLIQSAEKRYEYAVKRIADQQALWSLANSNGWALSEDHNGRQIVPVWPHEKYAALCAADNWSNCLPKSIDLAAWVERWIPGLEKDNRSISVFPIPAGKGSVVEPRRFEADIQEELSNYE